MTQRRISNPFGVEVLQVSFVIDYRPLFARGASRASLSEMVTTTSAGKTGIICKVIWRKPANPQRVPVQGIRARRDVEFVVSRSFKVEKAYPERPLGGSFNRRFDNQTRRFELQTLNYRLLYGTDQPEICFGHLQAGDILPFYLWRLGLDSPPMEFRSTQCLYGDRQNERKKPEHSGDSGFTGTCR